VHGAISKKEKAFLNVRGSCSGEGNYIAANSKFWAVPFAGGGGPVMIGRHDRPGRIDHTAPKLNVHKAAVLDLAFHPFNENVLATAGEEGFLKISVLPDDLSFDKITEANVTLEGHSKKLSFVRWNPNASGILATLAFDNLLKVWDSEQAKEVINVDEHPDLPCSIEWNENGSLLATSCKDKFMRIFDPRSKVAAGKTVGIEGGKAWRVFWMDNRNKIGAIGFSKSNARQVGVWDARSLTAPINMQDLDTSASVAIPYYDYDTSVLFVAGKGDASIKYFELTDEDPYLFFLTDFRDTEATKGVCFLPKTVCDTKLCEIAVCYRLMKEWISPVSFQVPRKTENFASDIFPDTYAGVAAMSGSEWMAGANKPIIKRSMKPGTVAPTSTVSTSVSTTASTSASTSASTPSGGAASDAEKDKELASLKAENKDLKAQIAAMMERLAKLEAK